MPKNYGDMEYQASTRAILSGTGTALLPGITFSGDLNTGIYTPGADQIGFSTGGSLRLTINNEGALVIADTTAPGVTTNKLYAVAGDLFWNGVAVGGGIANIVEDTTPQLGGNLDVNTFDINSTEDGGALSISSGSGISGNISGGSLTLSAGDGFGYGTGGDITITSGTTSGDVTASGGNINITAGDGGASVSGGNIKLTPGDGGGATSVHIIGQNTTTGGTVRFMEASTNGTNGVNLQAPTSVATERTWTLPGDAPVNGQVVQTDGSGNLSLTNNDGRKNLVINGCMRVWQRGTSFTLTASSYTADKWLYAESSTATIVWSRQPSPLTSTPPGMNAGYYLFGNVTVADVSLGVANYAAMITKIEGRDLNELSWGQSQAKTVTLSFWHAHTAVGTYSIAIRNAALDRSYVAEYTQTSTNVWEKATITIVGETTGTWAIDNTLGLDLIFALGAGSNFTTSTLNAWQSVNKFASTNQVNAVSSTANFLKFGSMQLEVGDNATQFEHRPMAQELVLCQRYFQIYTGEVIGFGYAPQTTIIRTLIPSTVSMRASPSVVTTVGSIRLRGAGQDKTPTAVSIHSHANNGTSLDWTVTGATQNQGYTLIDAGTTISLKADL